MNGKKKLSLLGAIAAFFGMTIAPHAAWADEPRVALEEIIVTAQKREESIQDVPLSVQAFTGETLEIANVVSLFDLPRLVPNLNVARGAQTANLRLTIRGVGAAGNSAMDPSIGTFIDGVYVPRPGSVFASFNDMAGIEVLRGPQGTLFGRNSTVGGILLRTASPEKDLGGNIELQAGNYGMQKYSGVVNLPVSDRLAFRLAGLYGAHDGYAYNRLDGKDFVTSDTTAGRLGMKWDISDSLNWTVKVDYSKIGGDGLAEQEIDPATVTAAARANLNLIFGGNPPDLDNAFDHKSNQLNVGNLDDKQWGVVSDLSWDLSGDYTVRLLSGYRDWQNRQYELDVVFSPLDLLSRLGGFDSTSQSHELQLISPVGELFGGRFDYVAGLYYFQEDFYTGETLGLGTNFCNALVPPSARPACVASANKSTAAVLDFNQSATNYAIYAQGNIGITDSVGLTLGARWTNDEKTGTFVQQLNNPFAASVRAPENAQLKQAADDFTYRVGVNWKPQDDLLLFTSYSTGYKSGGFNSGGGAVALGQKRVFDKETSDNLEAGVKATLAGGTARLNVTVFSMNLKGYQDKAFDGTSYLVTNAGNLRNQGLEFDGDVSIANNITLFAALGYLDAEFTKYPNAPCLPYPSQVNPNCTQDMKGKRQVYAPEWQGSVGAQLEGDIGFGNLGYAFRTDLSYLDDTNVGTVNDNNPQGIQPSYMLLSARFSLLFGKDRQLSVSVFGDNLMDEGYCGNKFATTLDSGFGLRDPVTGGTVMRCTVAPPRTYGVSFKARM